MFTKFLEITTIEINYWTFQFFWDDENQFCETSTLGEWNLGSSDKDLSVLGWTCGLTEEA